MTAASARPALSAAPRPGARSRTKRRRRPARVARRSALALIAAAAVTAGCGGDPPPPPGAARAGTQVFADASCGGCHTLAAAGARGQVGPNLDTLRPGFEQVADRVRDGGQGMPPFADRLTDREIQSVAAYVADVAGGR